MQGTTAAGCCKEGDYEQEQEQDYEHEWQCFPFTSVRGKKNCDPLIAQMKRANGHGIHAIEGRFEKIESRASSSSHRPLEPSVVSSSRKTNCLQVNWQGLLQTANPASPNARSSYSYSHAACHGSNRKTRQGSQSRARARRLTSDSNRHPTPFVSIRVHARP